jgi:cytosine/adenosine deaminase-related metal-dependent hydrolase
MLERVRLLGYRSGFRRDEDIELLLHLATYGGAKVMGDTNYGLQIGKQADFVVIAGDTPAHAVLDHPRRTYVIKAGRVIAAEGEYQVF